jgi:LysR family hydrogen peroxide-inducible transcriptional activator
MIYALYPETTISVHVAWGFKKQNTAVMIGKSIVNKTSTVDIGELCLKYGGGGHHNAGTCQLDNDTVDAQLPDIIEALKRDKIDAALVASGTCGEGIIERDLFSDTFYAYVSPSNPLFERSNIRFEDIDMNDLIMLSRGNCMRDQIIELCEARRGLPTHYYFESGSLDTLMRIVDCTSSMTIIPEMALEYIPSSRKQQIKTLAKSATSRRIAIAIRRTYVKTSIISALEQTIMEKISMEKAAR